MSVVDTPLSLGNPHILCSGCQVGPFYFYSFFDSFHLLSSHLLILLLSPYTRSSDPGFTNYQAFLPLPPLYGTCLHLHRDNTSALASLIDSHRITPPHTLQRAPEHLIPLICYAPIHTRCNALLSI